MNLEQFLMHIFKIQLQYHIYQEPVIQYESTHINDIGKCYKCNEHCNIILSHSISKSWYKKNNYFIYSPTYDPYLSEKEKKISYKLIQLFFSNQSNDGDQYKQEFLPLIKQYISYGIETDIFHNLFKSSLSYYKYYVHSTFNMLCHNCEQMYTELDSDNFINNFFEPNQQEKHFLLLERFELYFYNKRDTIIKAFQHNSDTLEKNIAIFSDIYLKDNNIHLKIPLLMEQSLKKLNILLQELINTKIKKQKHSFIGILLGHKDFKALFDLYYSDDDYYNNIHQFFINIVQSHITNPQYLQEMFSQLNFEHINTIYDNMSRYKKDIDSYLKKYVGHSINSNLSNFKTKEIKNIYPELYGFSRIDTSMLNTFFKTSDFSDNSLVYFFTSPVTKKEKTISAYFIEEEQDKLLLKHIEIFSKQKNRPIEEIKQVLFFYAFIAHVDNLNIYSQNKFVIEEIIKLKEKISNSDSDDEHYTLINNFLKR